MSHDWIIRVLSDLVAYARGNGLDSTAEAGEALRKVAEAEIAAAQAARNGPASAPPQGKVH